MKLIIEANPDDFILAVRAAKIQMERSPDRRLSVVSFEGGVSFVVTKNKASLTVRHVTGHD